MLRWAGFGANAEMRAELARQKTDIADIRTSLDRTSGEAATLGARTEDLVRSDAAQSDRLAKLDDEVAMLKAKFRALLPADPLESLANGGTDVLTLRTTLDAQAERSRHEYIALNKRIDYLENLIVTGARCHRVGPPAAGKAQAPRLAWGFRGECVAGELGRPGARGRRATEPAFHACSCRSSRPPLTTPPSPRAAAA